MAEDEKILDVNQEARIQLAHEIKVNMPNLSDGERAAALAIFEAGAASMGMGFSEYLEATFPNGVFGNFEEAQEQAQKKGVEINGGVAISKNAITQNVNAVIYASKTADFSTWVHELAHVWQAQLTGKLKTDAEKAFQVQNGNWQESTYTFSDGHTDTSAEAFAYGFEDFLKHTAEEMATEDKNAIFEKFADYMSRTYNGINENIKVSEEIAKVYEAFVTLDDNILSEAEKAVREEKKKQEVYDNAIDIIRRESIEINNGTHKEKKEVEEIFKAIDSVKNQNDSRNATFSVNTVGKILSHKGYDISTITEKLGELYETSKRIISEPEIKKEGHKEHPNFVAYHHYLNKFRDSNGEEYFIRFTLNEEKVRHGQGKNVLHSTFVSDVDIYKKGVQSNALGIIDPHEELKTPTDLKLKQFLDSVNIQFQLVGERSIMRMAESEEKQRILDDLKAAKLMDEKFKSMDSASRVYRIRAATGWEKSADGRWKYETDDSINRIKSGSLIEKMLNTSPDLLAELSKRTPLAAGDVLDAPELFKIFPFMKNVSISFYSDPNAFRAVLTPEGIKLNTQYLKASDGEKGLKGVLAHEIQHVIQAVEFSESTGIQGKNIESLYNNMMSAMKAADTKQYDYDLTSLQNGLDSYMKDIGEIEARNVARRITMSYDQRRHTTLESTEDIKRTIQFQTKNNSNGDENMDEEKKAQIARLMNVIKQAKGLDNEQTAEHNYEVVDTDLVVKEENQEYIVENNKDDFIEKMQANGGMSEAAMEADIEVEEKSYSWNEIVENAMGKGNGDVENSAYNKAREEIAEYAKQFEIDIENAEVPEDEIDDFVKEHREISFGKDGNILIDEHFRNELNDVYNNQTVQEIIKNHRPLVFNEKEDISLMKDISSVITESEVFAQNNETLGNVRVRFGNPKHSGLSHIIKRRMDKLIEHNGLTLEDAQKETASIIFLAVKNIAEAPATKETNGRYAIYKNGIKTAIDTDKNGKFIVTGFDFDDTQKEATDAIMSVNAHYGYAPEFLEIYAQVGAVYASLTNNIVQQNSTVNENSSLEQIELLQASEALKNMQFSPDNWEKLIHVLNEIKEISGNENLKVPTKAEVEQNIEKNKTQSPLSKNPVVENQKVDNINENIQPSEPFDLSKVVYGKTVIPPFTIMIDGKMQNVENAVVLGYDNSNHKYLLQNGEEKISLARMTLNKIFKNETVQEQQIQASKKPEIKNAEGRAIVFADKERGITGTVIPEFSMITSHGFEDFKDCVVTKHSEADNSYTLSNGEKTLVVDKKTFEELTAEDRFNKSYDENSSIKDKMLTRQYKDFFELRDNTSYNFIHNLSVYCRNEANSPVDALKISKQIVEKMSDSEKAKTKKLLKNLCHEGETINEFLINAYHNAIKEQPLNEEYIKTYQPQERITVPFYDTVSSNGQYVDNNPSLERKNKNYNLKVGDTLTNVNISQEKLFRHGKENVHFDELKVISASKEGNSITLMDSNKSFIEVPRDTFLASYTKQQEKIINQEQKNQNKNSIQFSISR